jgi:hypothetical protein
MDDKTKKAVIEALSKEPFKRLNDHAAAALTGIMLPHQVNKVDERVYSVKEVEVMLNDVLNKANSINFERDATEIAEYVTKYLEQNA